MANIAKILILDDEEDTKDLFQQAFRQKISEENYFFSFAKTKQEAENLLSQEEYDIFVFDMSVVAFDITDFVKNIKKNYPFLEIIIVSAYSDISILRTVMRCGAHDFIVKPINFQDFDIVLDNTLHFVQSKRLAEYNAQKLNVISGEIGLSAQLQKSILPGNELKYDSLEIWADSVPTAEVGGDFYDFFWLSDTKIGIVIADVSGKNISAAMFAVITKTLIKTFAKICDTPSECFKHVNHTLCEENVATMFVTAIYGIFDLNTKKLTYTNAGHLPIVDIKPHTEPTFLNCDTGIALGIMDDIEFVDNTHDIVPGEMLLLYTDGVTEAANRNGDEFDFERLMTTIKNSHINIPKLLTQQVFNSIREFVNGADQSDDITTLCFKYKTRIIKNVT